MKPYHFLLSISFAVASTYLQAESPALPLPAVSAKLIKNDDRVLSSNEFLGRGPGEAGEEKAITYIEKSFKETGIEPAGDAGTFFQDLPLVRLDRHAGASLSVKIGHSGILLELGRNATLAL